MKHTFATLLTIFCSTVFAQQESLISMYWNIKEYYNPAATGIDYRHQASVQYRNQWTGISGHPVTLTGTYGAKVDKVHGGLGITGSYDHAGSLDVSKVGANYSYHLKLGESVLGMGVQAGIINSFYDGVSVVPQTTDDNSLPAGNTGSTEFNAAAGLFYKWNKLTIGASATQLGSQRNTQGQYDPVTHYWFTGAYEVDFAENFQLTPSVLFVTEGNFYTATTNLKATLFKNIWVGASYRNRDAFSFMAGYDLFGKFRAGYCFEQIVSRLNNGATGGTHEVFLGFLLK